MPPSTRRAAQPFSGPPAEEFAPRLQSIRSTDQKQAVWAGSGPVTLFNRDQKTTIYLGADGFDPAGNELHVLDPLASLPFAGKHDIYAQTRAGSALLQSTPGAGTITPSPAMVAAQIAAAGVFLLTNTTSLVVSPQATLPAAGSTVLGPFTFTQPGYELLFTAWSLGGATIPAVCLDMAWSDSVTGSVVDRQRWWVNSSSNAAGQSFYGTGPTAGDTLTVTVINADPGAFNQFALNLATTSRQPRRHDIRQLTTNAIVFATSGTYDLPADILLFETPAIGASNTATRWAGLYSGQVQLDITSSLPATAQLLSQDASLAGAAGQVVWQGAITGAGGGQLAQQIALPRAQCYLAITNGSTTTTNNVTASMVILEQ